MFLISHSYNPFYFGSKEHMTIAGHDDYDTAIESFLVREACTVYRSERVMCVMAQELQDGFLLALS